MRGDGLGRRCVLFLLPQTSDFDVVGLGLEVNGSVHGATQSLGYASSQYGEKGDKQRGKGECKGDEPFPSESQSVPIHRQVACRLEGGPGPGFCGCGASVRRSVTAMIRTLHPEKLSPDFGRTMRREN